MVVLNDVQVAAITSLAGPLQAQERQAFMSALFELLLGWRPGYMIGDGELHRTLRDLQRKHFTPPETEESRLSCYSRHGPQPRGYERRV
jgi:hypothetical protein